MTVPGLDLPAPPPGPGVNPPFAAPPADRNRRGLWLGLGIGGLVLVLCCVGGVVGIAILGASVTSQLGSQAHTVVTGYLDALRDEEYDAAYDLLCSDFKARLTRSEFVAQRRTEPRPVSYVLGATKIGNAVVVPAEVSYSDHSSASLTFTLVDDTGTSELKVCRITG